MYLSIIFLPLLSFLISSLFANYISKKGSILITNFLMFMSVLLSFIIFYEVVLCQSICNIKLFLWIDSNFFIIYWGFFFDNLTSFMLIVVTFISFLVHVYSTSYMSEDPHLPRFMSYLSLFTFFMLILISADNFLQMFVGWEGVGLASYLLINFWSSRYQANKAAIKAIVINRIGDIGLSLAIALIFYSFKTVDFVTIFCLVPSIFQEDFLILGYKVSKITLITCFLFLGAVGKSAQIGLHTWLPDAMEGPTPVSALIHAATMVTAGVFVLLRCSPLIEYSENGLLIIGILGALTAFMAATIGVVQNDLKKVIAYSTCSQLGYMVFSIGLSNYSVSFFHLTNHAFFKALLFLSAGSIIHAMSDEQDMRRLGGLVKVVPVTYLMIVIGSMSLMGFPFLTGFYSKDALLEFAYGIYETKGFFTYWLGTISAFLTSFYSIRLIYLTFFGPVNSWKIVMKNSHESSWIILTPLIILSFSSIFIGYFLKELFLGSNVDTWNSIFLVLPWHEFFFITEFLPSFIKLIPVIFSLTGAFFSFFFFQYYQYKMQNLKNYINFYSVYHFLIKKWYFDLFYNQIIAKIFLNFGYYTSFKLLDRGLFEILGPFGIVNLIKKTSYITSELQTGLIYHYILIMLLSLTLILLISILPFYFTITIFFVYIYLFIYLRITSIKYE